MADWSRIPGELMKKIAVRLDSVHTTRVRSVCSDWRAAVHPPPRLISPGLPPFQFSGFSLSVRSIFLLFSLSVTNDLVPKPWMAKVEQVNGRLLRLYNPMADYHVESFPARFPRIVDLSDVRVVEMGQEYSLVPNGFLDPNSAFFDRIAYLDGVLLCTHFMPSYKLCVYKSGENGWVTVDESGIRYHDVIAYHDRLYAVDASGRLVAVQFDDDGVAYLTLAAESIDSIAGAGGQPFLVETASDLLMAVMLDDVTGATWFEVYRLDEGGKKWGRVDRLDGLVLFLNDARTFSVSAAADLGWTFDNCICYYFSWMTPVARPGIDDPLRELNINIFELGTGRTRPLHEFRDLSDLFYPIPFWMYSG